MARVSRSALGVGVDDARKRLDATALLAPGDELTFEASPAFVRVELVQLHTFDSTDLGRLAVGDEPRFDLPGALYEAPVPPPPANTTAAATSFTVTSGAGEFGVARVLLRREPPPEAPSGDTPSGGGGGGDGGAANAIDDVTPAVDGGADDGMPWWLIAAIAGGACLLILCVAALVAAVRRRRANSSSDEVELDSTYATGYNDDGFMNSCRDEADSRRLNEYGSASSMLSGTASAAPPPTTARSNIYQSAGQLSAPNSINYASGLSPSSAINYGAAPTMSTVNYDRAFAPNTRPPVAYGQFDSNSARQTTDYENFDAALGDGEPMYDRLQQPNQQYNGAEFATDAPPPTNGPPPLPGVPSGLLF